MDRDSPEEMRQTPFARIGGAEVVSRIVDRFYDLMDADPAFAALRAMHAEDLGGTRASLKDFLTAWLGGPRDWFVRRPGTCIMSLHRALPVTEETALQWLEAMARALDETAVDLEVAILMRDAFARMARQMSARAAG